MLKRCTKCKEKKKAKLFNLDNTRKDKLSCWCKECNNIRWRNAYRNNPKFKAKHLSKKWLGGDLERMKLYNERRYKKSFEKISAGGKLRYAVRVGKIVKKPCIKCGSKKSQAHHPDYSKPLEVIWVCDIHHKEIHKRLAWQFDSRFSPNQGKKEEVE